MNHQSQMTYSTAKTTGNIPSIQFSASLFSLQATMSVDPASDVVDQTPSTGDEYYNSKIGERQHLQWNTNHRTCIDVVEGKRTPDVLLPDRNAMVMNLQA